jgi:hypothetical protein
MLLLRPNFHRRWRSPNIAIHRSHQVACDGRWSTADDAISPVGLTECRSSSHIGDWRRHRRHFEQAELLPAHRTKGARDEEAFDRTQYPWEHDGRAAKDVHAPQVGNGRRRPSRRCRSSLAIAGRPLHRLRRRPDVHLSQCLHVCRHHSVAESRVLRLQRCSRASIRLAASDHNLASVRVNAWISMRVNSQPCSLNLSSVRFGARMNSSRSSSSVRRRPMICSTVRCDIATFLSQE